MESPLFAGVSSHPLRESAAVQPARSSSQERLALEQYFNTAQITRSSDYNLGASYAPLHTSFALPERTPRKLHDREPLTTPLGPSHLASHMHMSHAVVIFFWLPCFPLPHPTPSPAPPHCQRQEAERAIVSCSLNGAVC